MTAPLTGHGLRLVLDTNVVLDWLLFNDAALDSLRHAIDSQQATILTHHFACDEFARVLTYPQLALDTQRQRALMDSYLQRTQLAALDADFGIDNLQLPDLFPQCRDADDQPFLALCFHTQADALITRDKALLSLRKRCRRFAVRIMDYRELSASF